VTPFLLDSNLSRFLARRLADTFPGSVHTSDLELGEAADLQIWQAAKSGGFTILSKDFDFHRLALSRGWPPKVVILAVGNSPTWHVETVLRSNIARIEQFDSGDESVLVIRAPYGGFDARPQDGR